MNKSKKSKLAVLLLALVLVLGASAQATIAYLTAETGTITNTFKPVQTPEHNLNIDLIGTKVLEGRDWQADDSFAFTLQMKQDGEWMQIGTAEATKDNQKFDFTGQLKQQLTSAGTYEFRVSEVKGNIADVTYDETVFGFDVKVISTDGAMSIAGVEKTNAEQAGDMNIKKDGGTYSVEMKFTNIYKEPEPTKPSEPTDPSDPSDPTDPSDPSEPSDPSKPTDPSDPTKPGDQPSDKDDTSQTGDDFRLLPLLMLMIAAGAAAVFAATLRRSKTE